MEEAFQELKKKSITKGPAECSGDWMLKTRMYKLKK